jgi:hypothetical protein
MSAALTEKFVYVCTIYAIKSRSCKMVSVAIVPNEGLCVYIRERKLLLTERLCP